MSGAGKRIVLYSGPEHASRVAEQVLGEDFDLVRVAPEPEVLLPAFQKCTVYLDASMKVPISESDIGTANDLRLIVTATTGATHIDQNALAARRIPLLTLKGQHQFLRNLTPAAEHSWALLMACARRLRGAVSHVLNGGWERVEFPGLMLKGRTLGLIGMGRIGTWMSRYAAAFGMSVVYYDPYAEDVSADVEPLSLEELVCCSDIISIHVHVTEETKGMINQDLLDRFKPGVVFINTSRAELVDEAALVKALKEGRISAVGTDVLLGEPHIENSPLWQYSQESENVLITPHIGGYCPDAVDKVVEFSSQRVREFFENE